MMRSNFQLFTISLKRHPGVGIAALFSVLCFIAGYTSVIHPGLYSGLAGFVVSSIFWIPVLITAWTDRNQYKSWTVDIIPFEVPNHVTVSEGPSTRNQGWKEPRTFALSDLSNETLEEMCEAFRKEVFRKANSGKVIVPD